MSVQYLSACSAQAVKYVAHLLRGIQIARLNTQIANSGGASLMCLPDDVLLMVLDMTEQYDNQSCMREFKNLTMCNKRLRSLAWPGLFQQIHLGSSWSPGRMVNSLKLLEQTEEALRAARELHVDLWPGPTQTVPSEVLEELGNILAGCMSRMDRLDTISISTTLPCSVALRTAFDNANVDFPQIREITAGYHLDWLIDFCPNLETISSDDWLACEIPTEESEFVQAAGAVTGLQNFSYTAYWNAELIDHVHRTMPQLRTLGIRGRILPSLEEFLISLRKFRHLRSLALPDASMLSGLDFPKCQSGLITSAQEAAVALIFKQLPRLEEIQLGRCFRAWITSNTNRIGGVDIQWDAVVGTEGQTWTRHTRSKCHSEFGQLHLKQEDIRSLHRIDDDLASIFSGVDDSASIFSRTDTLAF